MNKDKPVDKIIEGNKLIAEFDGRKFQAYKDNHSYTKEFNTYSECEQFIKENKLKEYYPEIGWQLGCGKYHTSWDWLFPSWNKCYLRLIEINSTSCHLFIEEMKKAMILGDIIKVWSILVKAIKYINEQFINTKKKGNDSLS